MGMEPCPVTAKLGTARSQTFPGKHSQSLLALISDSSQPLLHLPFDFSLKAALLVQASPDTLRSEASQLPQVGSRCAGMAVRPWKRAGELECPVDRLCCIRVLKVGDLRTNQCCSLFMACLAISGRQCGLRHLLSWIDSRDPISHESL